MDSVLALINEYGMVIYVILFSYCALKSGWLPLFAAYAAYVVNAGQFLLKLRAARVGSSQNNTDSVNEYAVEVSR